MHFVKRLEKFNDIMMTNKALYPILNIPLCFVDLAFFIARHDDHHLARMVELKRKFENEKK